MNSYGLTAIRGRLRPLLDAATGCLADVAHGQAAIQAELACAPERLDFVAARGDMRG